MPRGFFFDNSRCTGCRTCAMACADYHDNGADLAFRVVLDYEGGSWSEDAHGALSQDAFAYHISLACNHCNQPVCMQVCPTGAMHKDEYELVWPDQRKCIGCGYCTMACPYHAPHISPRSKRSSKCDGCRTRVAEGLMPICVDACPLRALDFGEGGELLQRHSDCVQSILPLPDAQATQPNLFIAPSPAAQYALGKNGRIVNRAEVGLS